MNLAEHAQSNLAYSLVGFEAEAVTSAIVVSVIVAVAIARFLLQRILGTSLREDFLQK